MGTTPVNWMRIIKTKDVPRKDRVNHKCGTVYYWVDNIDAAAAKAGFIGKENLLSVARQCKELNDKLKEFIKSDCSAFVGIQLCLLLESNYSSFAGYFKDFILKRIGHATIQNP
jgi:hypothetical protein